MPLLLQKVSSVLQHLVEGCSLHTTQRITDVEKRTILSLLALLGQRCLLEQRIHALWVKDVQCDEVWRRVA